MNVKTKKELMEEYKNRHPEKGVISYKCKETGESFLGTSKDTKADFNSTSFKLEGKNHPNRRLQELWSRYGIDGFELSVLKILKYDNPADDHTSELEELREECLQADPQAKKIWR
ncbi:GIY-YIG nuclease family protein [Kineothrix sp. MB12-C1]|uniref:GIY-YIG nuclease family protein n=1 Tax=Kineothrix sp. MB12-C1 TaxID=3070215 RepID=UPI0027D33F38|nr:GIY-YIG nuclease family protein [Kineothrix sp. MB12-C1]WMC93418.1 GIY-YIG nuclease family protein [Kineothrix sp. MB12-C1]